MSNDVNVQMTIGGRLPQHLLTTFRGLLDEFREDWDGKRLCYVADLLDLCDTEGCLTAYRQGSGSEELEGFCVQYALPFDRRIEAGGGWDAEWRAFRPGVCDMCLTLDCEGHVVVLADEALAAARGDEKIRKDFLDRYKNYPPADLPPFEIVPEQ